MLKRSIPLITRLTLVVLFIYAEILGATATGILLPESRLFTLCVLLAVVSAWLLIRQRLNWQWHHTPMDLAWLLWGLVLCLSLAANIDSARGILLSMWYAGIYVGFWYFFQDLLANRAINRSNLVDIFLLGSVLIVIFGYIEFVIRYVGAGPFDLTGTHNIRSLFTGPNALATFLLVSLFLLLGRLTLARETLARIALSLYLIAIVALLYLTTSRSAWLVAAITLLLWLVLILNSSWCHFAAQNHTEMANAAPRYPGRCCPVCSSCCRSRRCSRAASPGTDDGPEPWHSLYDDPGRIHDAFRETPERLRSVEFWLGTAALPLDPTGNTV